MIKKIYILLLVTIILCSCGKKGDPEYKDLKQKAEMKIILKNKA